jgi:hypothetical protein
MPIFHPGENTLVRKKSNENLFFCSLIRIFAAETAKYL